jgi:hypothetical protein
MLRLKNRPGAIILLYDDDESLASRCATALTQRGYDNVFMLSGGIRVAKMKYPEFGGQWRAKHGQTRGGGAAGVAEDAGGQHPDRGEQEQQCGEQDRYQ